MSRRGGAPAVTSLHGTDHGQLQSRQNDPTARRRQRRLGGDGCRPIMCRRPTRTTAAISTANSICWSGRRLRRFGADARCRMVRYCGSRDFCLIIGSLCLHLELGPTARFVPTNSWCGEYSLRNSYPRSLIPLRREEFYSSCLEGNLYTCARLLGHIPKSFDPNQGAFADTRLLGKDDVLDAQRCACCS